MSNRVGLDAFQKFYNMQRLFHGNKVTYSFDEMLNFYGKKKDVYLNFVGDLITDKIVTQGRLDAALNQLARDSNGLILKNPILISNYIQNQAVKMDWVEMTKFVAIESSKDILKGAAAIGDSIISTGKILTYLLPVIVIGGLFIYANQKSGGGVMRGIRGLKK